ncbi:hypothetical protein BKH42_08500 [Helicobacter sp. 13S00482-2]|uniref:hypothetical protein n=1 Tax=Helicobacter sp. 13S00482-2 TaxID=1476200 RepID=UPI000BA7AEFC|nr:hypothetical protein [Helicobacter sp. 13S00482-2]PAF52968.1 hypothetical protein BKH42_08500 [Helicobacter sp. 13S00482-2]
MKTIIKSNKLIKGRKADYSPLWFFTWQGKIYQKLKFDKAYELGFKYPLVDVLDTSTHSYFESIIWN